MFDPPGGELRDAPRARKKRPRPADPSPPPPHGSGPPSFEGGGLETSAAEVVATAASSAASSSPSSSAKRHSHASWSEDDHREFVSGIFDVGLNHSSPSAIVEHMRDPSSGRCHVDVTVDRVKSRLQKYRKNREKSKQEFMDAYDGALKRFAGEERGGRSAAGGDGTAPRSGEVAAYLTRETLNEKYADDDDGGGVVVDGGDAWSAAASLSRLPRPPPPPPVGPSGGGGTLIIPPMSEAEMSTPLGQSVRYLLGLFGTLTDQLGQHRRRAEQGWGQATTTRPLAQGPPSPQQHPAMHGHVGSQAQQRWNAPQAAPPPPVRHHHQPVSHQHPFPAVPPPQMALTGATPHVVAQAIVAASMPPQHPPPPAHAAPPLGVPMHVAAPPPPPHWTVAPIAPAPALAAPPPGHSAVPEMYAGAASNPALPLQPHPRARQSQIMPPPSHQGGRGPPPLPPPPMAPNHGVYVAGVLPPPPVPTGLPQQTRSVTQEPY